MGAKENKETDKHVVDLLNSAKSDPAKIAAIFEYYAPDYIFHSTQGEMNLEQYKKYTLAYVSAFPDFIWKINHQVAEDNMTVLHYTTIATNTGSFRGMAPTGNKINIEIIFINKWEGGKLAETWSLFDNLAMMTQLGLVPGPAKK
jgi:predicted ester cyclase